MKGLISRLLIFFLGIPAIVAVTYFFRQNNGMGISLLTCLFSGLGGIEVSMLFPAGRKKLRMAVAFIIALSIPLTDYLVGLKILPASAFSLVIAALVLVVMTREIFRKTEAIPAILERLSALFFPILYPGFLAIFIIRIGQQANNLPLFLLFFSICFGNDSAAWFFGMLLGKKRNVIPVSPNKSIAGFLGGMATSTLLPLAFTLARPDIYAGALWKYLLLGFFSGLAVVFGDLAESAIKRSAGVKDSGSLIPGRGGVLDSIDSLLFAAPVFLFFSQLLFSGF